MNAKRIYSKIRGGKKQIAKEGSHCRTKILMTYISINYLKVKKSIVSIMKSKNKDVIAQVDMRGSIRTGNLNLSAFI